MKHIKKCCFADVLLLLTLLFVGGFHEYISCVVAAAASVYLLLRLKRNGKLTIRKDLLTSAVVAVCLGYGFSCLWAVDRGMAVIGFLKFLPLLLYILCLQQETDTDTVLEILPVFAAIMTVISAIGMQFEATKALFSVAGRLAGFFQYPNTFAIFLLICQLLCLKKPEKKIWDYLLILVLVAGLLLTGSRTAFVVAVAANLGMLLVMSGKNLRKILFIGLGAVCLLGALLLLGENSVLRRYLTISLTESTFVGRVLYWLDALPLLLKYPFGMGYMGYFYAQQSVQTGVYSVAYIHNDFLQLALDAGLLPCGLFVAALVQWFFKKTVPAADKIIVGAVCVHSFFEFHFQFLGMLFLLLLLLHRQPAEKTLSHKAGFLLRGSLGAAVLAGVYMAAALSLAHFGARQLSDALYPYNTQNKLSMLEQEQDVEKAYALAEDILKQNKDYYVSYSVRAKYYYSKGEFGQVIENQRAALARNPFLYSEYESYCRMLITGIGLYEKAGDTKSAQICKQELLAVAGQLEENKDRLSPLGKLIDDQPVTVLPEEIREYVRRLEAFQ